MTRWIVLCLLLAGMGCSHKGSHTPAKRTTLESYAAQLPDASKPGVAVRRLVDEVSSSNQPPDERLAAFHRHLLDKWQYIPDPPGQDNFGNAEQLVASGKLRGDCEDCCAVLVAGCRVLGLTCRVCLGESGKLGHAWVEVLIGTDRDLDAPFRKRLLDRFGDSAALVTRKEGHWLQLSPRGTLTSFTATHAITIEGTLVTLSIP